MDKAILKMLMVTVISTWCCISARRRRALGAAILLPLSQDKPSMAKRSRELIQSRRSVATITDLIAIACERTRTHVAVSPSPPPAAVSQSRCVLPCQHPHFQSAKDSLNLKYLCTAALRHF